MGISIITKSEEKHLPWWKRSTAPWWLIPLIFCYAIYNVVTVNQASHESFEKFKKELNGIKKPIMYFGVAKVTEEPTKENKQLILQDDALTCILNAKESSKRPPSNDYAMFMHFELAGSQIQLEVRQYDKTFWYTPWVKQKYGYKGYGFSASGKCDIQLVSVEI